SAAVVSVRPCAPAPGGAAALASALVCPLPPTRSPDLRRRGEEGVGAVVAPALRRAAARGAAGRAGPPGTSGGQGEGVAAYACVSRTGKSVAVLPSKARYPTGLDVLRHGRARGGRERGLRRGPCGAVCSLRAPRRHT